MDGNFAFVGTAHIHWRTLVCYRSVWHRWNRSLLDRPNDYRRRNIVRLGWAQTPLAPNGFAMVSHGSWCRHGTAGERLDSFGDPVWCFMVARGGQLFPLAWLFLLQPSDRQSISMLLKIRRKNLV